MFFLKETPLSLGMLHGFLEKFSTILKPFGLYETLLFLSIPDYGYTCAPFIHSDEEHPGWHNQPTFSIQLNWILITSHVVITKLLYPPLHK
jgi:hypothetical protein